MKLRYEFLGIALVMIMATGCAKKMIENKSPLTHVKKQMAKLAPIELAHDLSYLPENEVEVVKLLVKASKHLDDIFLMQVDEANPQMANELAGMSDEGAETYEDFFKIMFGPWDRLDAETPFINEADKPLGAGYYPLDMTKEEFQEWVKTHPDDQKDFESNFTVIRRKGSDLVAIPYSEYYREDLEPAVNLLKQAASKTEDKTLQTFLNSRADALLSNDYYQSDMDWMDLAGDIEVVFGPYEVYEDNLFGYKAAYESFVCVVDHEESEKLEVIGKYLNDMEASLPIPDKHKNFERGASSPIKVVNEIFTAGDTKAGIQTSAFNLPNDERVREAKGSKKVMLKNVMRAKFDKCWIPIVQNVLHSKDLERVSFDAYFNHVLMHEMAHALGPGQITVNGKETTVNRELADLYSTIEECKADVLGMYTAQFLIDKKVFPKELEKTLYASNLGGMFRSIRFGIGSAHGGGVAMQLNYYLDAGAFKVDEDGRFSANDRRMKKAVRDLSRELLMIQAKGDYDAAAAFIAKYKVVRPEVQAALDRLTDVPIDIRPIFPIENEVD